MQLVEEYNDFSLIFRFLYIYNVITTNKTDTKSPNMEHFYIYFQSL